MGRRGHPRAAATALCLLALATLVAGCRRYAKKPPREEQASRYLFDRHFTERAETDGEDDDDFVAGAFGYVHAKGRFVWIRRKPDADAEWIGYLTLGQRAALRRGRPEIGSSGCDSWVPIQPRGWICVGRDATLDPDDEVFVRLRERTANVTSPWPFEYARSLGAPRYRSLPTQRDQLAREGKSLPLLLDRIEKARAAKDEAAILAIDKRLLGVELGLTGEAPPPAFVPTAAMMESDEDIELGSTIAYVDEFDHDGRAWLLGWDHAIIPQVRVKKYPRSEFRGVEIDGDVDVPLAFARKQGALKYRADKDGKLTASGDRFASRALIELGEGQLDLGDQRMLETEEPGVYVATQEVVWVAPEGRLPKGLPDEGRRTWVEISTVGGWLVAYEGRQPVYATAISAGRASLKPDGTMVPASSTPTGTYPIHSKLRSTTMRSDRRPNRSHAEVMYTQVFYEDYALHGAYWHDDWGDRKSAGCVNLAPIDSKWLFDWSEPEVPDGWHTKNHESGEAQTLVVVHL